MSKKILYLFLLLAFSASFAYSVEISGVNIPETLELSSQKLVLNGAGLRTKLFIKLYVGGLYLEKKEKDPDKIMQGDSVMGIKLHITSSLITSKKMEETIREGFEKSTGGNTAPIEKHIKLLLNIFKDEIKENDIFDLIYVPGKGVDVYKNGKFASVVEGMEFKKALFGIWLGKNPAQKSLKNEMLGI